MKSFKQILTTLTLAVLLTGCASLGNEKPEGFKQQFAYAVGVHQAIVDATASSFAAGQLERGDAVYIDTRAHEARTVLDAALAADEAGDAAGAQSKLAIALTGLTALQEYLRAHGEKK